LDYNGGWIDAIEIHHLLGGIPHLSDVPALAILSRSRQRGGVNCPAKVSHVDKQLSRIDRKAYENQ
jgi:hypothetical protein